MELGAFKDTNTAEANPKPPASKVQTAGFGSPSGMPGCTKVKTMETSPIWAHSTCRQAQAPATDLVALTAPRVA